VEIPWECFGVAMEFPRRCYGDAMKA